MIVTNQTAAANEASHDHLASILTVFTAAQDFVSLMEDLKHKNPQALPDGLVFSQDAHTAYKNLRDLIHHHK